MVKKSNANNHCLKKKCKGVTVAEDMAAAVDMVAATAVAMGADTEVDTVAVMEAATVVAVSQKHIISANF